MPEIKMRGWAVVCIWRNEFMIRRMGAFDRLPGFDDRQRCEWSASYLNRNMALGRSRYPPGFTGEHYYVVLPYPVIQESPTRCEEDLDDPDIP
jgi:hypothetical protein